VSFPCPSRRVQFSSDGKLSMNPLTLTQARIWTIRNQSIRNFHWTSLRLTGDSLKERLSMLRTVRGVQNV
jgi:hypothetical protein